ncbi:MAG: TonB-dependent receptor [candidate division KSB1 bacterium]|nr:TonB-dependent receptor [candidate division KSB1 bacterium]
MRITSTLFVLFIAPLFAATSNDGAVSGFVRDARNGEFMPYVNVFLDGTSLGTTTNDRGYFVINRIPAGQYTLVLSMIGYERKEEPIIVKPGETLKRNFLLTPQVIEVEEIIKTAERERFEREVQVSTTTISARQLSTLPSVAEADVFRTLQLLPGVVSRTDFSSQLYVRGGSPDQNLVLLDGVTVYNPFHLLGLFSMFNADAVKQIDFIAGGFPAEYGGRLSSVLSITNKEGNSQHFEGHANISLLSARAAVEGPLPRGSFLFSGRRTYFDQVFKGTRYDFPYYFYDLQGKINFDLNENHRLTLSGFFGDDRLDYLLDSDEDITLDLYWLWGNRTTSLYWRWVMHPNLYSETRLTRSKFNLELDLGLTNENTASLQLKNGIQDYSADLSFSFFGFKNHSFKFGLQQTFYDFLYSFTIDKTPLFDYHRRPYLSSLYVQDEWQSGRWSLRAGARIEHYSYGKRTTFSPRFGAKYRLTQNFALKSSLGIYHQFLTTSASDNQNYQFIDLWFPLLANFLPLRSEHRVLGLEWLLPFDLTMTLEGYYKTMHNLLELNEFGSAADETDDFFVGDGEAYGTEFMAKKSVGRVTGWTSYSFSVTRRRIGGLVYYPKHDRRHNINAALSVDLGKNWLLGVVFSYGSGLPYTPVLGKYAHYEWDFARNQYDYEVYNRLGKKNSYRYPDYHRLDISLRRPFEAFGVQCNPYLQIVNAYNRKNVFLYFWDHDANPSKQITIPMFPVLPTFGIEFDF